MVEYIYRPPKFDGPQAMNATLGVKFAQATRILDPWFIFGGTKWSRSLFRLKHPIIYSKRAIRKIYRRMKRVFIKDKMFKCLRDTK